MQINLPFGVKVVISVLVGGIVGLVDIKIGVSCLASTMKNKVLIVENIMSWKYDSIFTF